ncbi:leucine-rich repeat protein, partial [Anaerobutyricum soehngenii]
EFGEKVTEIPRLIRMGGNVKHVKFDGEVEKIGDAVFDGWSNIEEIEIPESVKEIGEWDVS